MRSKPTRPTQYPARRDHPRIEARVHSQKRVAAGTEYTEPVWLTERIAVLPRGCRETLYDPETYHTASMVSLGGAASVDYYLRTPNKEWCPEETIAANDTQRVVDGGYADILVTHEAANPPWTTDAVKWVLNHNDFGRPEASPRYSAASRAHVTAALLGVMPRLHVHGHMHVRGEKIVRLPGAVYQTSIWSLDGDGKAAQGNIRYLDLAAFSK